MVCITTDHNLNSSPFYYVMVKDRACVLDMNLSVEVRTINVTVAR